MREFKTNCKKLYTLFYKEGKRWTRMSVSGKPATAFYKRAAQEIYKPFLVGQTQYTLRPLKERTY